MTVKLLYTSNCSRTVPLIYLYCDNFPPDTRYLQKTQPIHIQTPITTKTSVLAMHSPQKSYPLLQVQLKTELFTIILTASSIMFIQSKKKKNYLPPFSLKPLLLEKIKVIRSADQTLRQLRESDQMFYATKMAN